MRIIVPIITLYFIVVCAGCQRFDSNALNHQLIQGNWGLVQIIYTDETTDSLVVENQIPSTCLQFDADSCIEVMEDIKRTRYFGFAIKNYVLRLDEDENNTNLLNIAKLTQDSLILRAGGQSWKYLRKSL